MKISPTEIFQKLCFQLKILYRLSYQWILGLISSFSLFLGLSVKNHPPRGYENEVILSENMIISLSVIFHRHHYLISRKLPISRCFQVKKSIPHA